MIDPQAIVGALGAGGVGGVFVNGAWNYLIQRHRAKVDAARAGADEAQATTELAAIEDRKEFRRMVIEKLDECETNHKRCLSENDTLRGRVTALELAVPRLAT